MIFFTDLNCGLPKGVPHIGVFLFHFSYQWFMLIPNISCPKTNILFLISSNRSRCWKGPIYIHINPSTSNFKLRKIYTIVEKSQEWQRRTRKYDDRLWQRSANSSRSDHSGIPHMWLSSFRASNHSTSRSFSSDSIVVRLLTSNRPSVCTWPWCTWNPVFWQQLFIYFAVHECASSAGEAANVNCSR